MDKRLKYLEGELKTQKERLAFHYREIKHHKEYIKYHQNEVEYNKNWIVFHREEGIAVHKKQIKFLEKKIKEVRKNA